MLRIDMSGIVDGTSKPSGKRISDPLASSRKSLVSIDSTNTKQTATTTNMTPSGHSRKSGHSRLLLPERSLSVNFGPIFDDDDEDPKTPTISKRGPLLSRDMVGGLSKSTGNLLDLDSDHRRSTFQNSEEDGSSRRNARFPMANDRLSMRSMVSTESSGSVSISSNTRHTASTRVTAPAYHHHSPRMGSKSTHSTSKSGHSTRRAKRSLSIDFLMKLDVPPLDFAAAGLVGREKEISTLKSCYDRLMMENGKKELILVGGQSGVGKSSVVRSLIETEIFLAEGLFVEGKFDMNTSNEPYSGIAKAFGIICRRLKELGPETVEDLREDLRHSLGDKPGLLTQLIPELEEIMRQEISDEVSTDPSIQRMDKAEGGVGRLRFAFRVLTRVFSSLYSPLILFFDDLQWADVSSLQILEYLISDAENDFPLMVIGSYRSEEVDENSLLHNKMITLREKTEKFQFEMTELMIEPFSTGDMEKLIEIVLPSMVPNAAFGLAALCHKRTLGSPYFAIEFLKMLHSENMLEYEEVSGTWFWNLSKIEQETMSAENVVSILEQHLRKLPEQEQALLQCAAYLGSTFSEPTLDLVWSVYGRRLVDTRIQPVSSLVARLVTDSVLEKAERKKYQWAHDKLQEAALSLAGIRRETFQLDIGNTLYYGLAKEQVEEDLFTIVDLINNGNTLRRREFAPINLRAAEKARGISAFQSAAGYAAEGVQLLQEDDWVKNKQLALDLYSIGAEAELILGNVGAAEGYISAVLSRDDLSTLEVLPLQIGRAKALSDVELKSKEALDYCLQLLKNLGCRLTWARPLALPQAYAKASITINRAKAKPQSFYENMKTSSDIKQKYIAFLLSQAAYNAYNIGDTAMSLLVTAKLVERTMKFGANQFSATAFAYLGVMSSNINRDYEVMERFHNIALGMIKKFRGMHASEAIYLGQVMGLLWVKPLETARPMVEHGISAGRIQGDLVYTSWCIGLQAVILPYTIGSPISSILESCPKILAEFEDTKLAAHTLSIKNYYQMLLNINDPSCENPSVHLGKIYTYTKDEHKGNIVHLADKIVAEGELVFWHEDYEVSAERALKVGETHKKLAPTNYLNLIESFHRAVALFAAAIKTKKGKYRRAANKIRKRLESLEHYGNTTLQYYCLFLTAERYSLEKRHQEAKLKYAESIEAVKELGHLHHLGLFNERYADFLLRDLGNEALAMGRLASAIRYYRQWGAVHKARALESRP